MSDSGKRGEKNLGDRSPSEKNNSPQSYDNILRTLQDDLTKWARGRFWFIAVLTSITGVLGLWTIFNQSLQFLLTKPVDKQLEQIGQRASELNTVLQGAIAASIKADVAKANAEQAAAEARRGLSDQKIAFFELHEQNATFVQSTKNNLEKSRDAIALINDTQIKLKEQSEKLQRDVQKIESRGIELTNDRALFEAKQKLQSDYVARSLKETASLLESLNTSDDRIAAFKSEMKTIEEEYIVKDNIIDRNSELKIIVYIKRGEGIEEFSNNLAKNLRTKGFRSDLWLATGDDSTSARKDIIKEFGGSDKFINENNMGVIIHPSMSDRIDEIRTALADYPFLDKINITQIKIEPDKKHLFKGSGSTYSPQEIALLFIISGSL